MLFRSIIDVRFDELVANPLATVRKIYTAFGYPYNADFEQRMARYLETQRAAARSRHVYAPEQFGLTRSEIIERSAEYLTWVQPRCGDLVEAGPAA